MKVEKKHKVLDSEQLNAALRASASSQFGVLDSDFLSKSVSLLNPPTPVSVKATAPVRDVMSRMKEYKMGCLTVEDEQGNLVGIFSERDYVVKVYEVVGEGDTPISEYMTPSPITISMTESIAHALSLMSQGGFRHLPVVDESGDMATGIISVKDVIDYIVESTVDDIMNFELEIETN